MYTEISAAFQSVKSAIALIKATQGLSNSTEVLTAVNDVQMKLSDAIASALASQEKQASLTERVRELEGKLRDIEDWKRQIQRYELFQFPTGTFAYKLKADMANGEPIHYLCSTCADKKQKTTLQPHYRHLNCPESRYHGIWTEHEPEHGASGDRRSTPSSDS
jgi:hypothetical protein